VGCKYSRSQKQEGGHLAMAALFATTYRLQLELSQFCDHAQLTQFLQAGLHTLFHRDPLFTVI
jgi:hypothetical protein